MAKPLPESIREELARRLVRIGMPLLEAESGVHEYTISRAIGGNPVTRATERLLTEAAAREKPEREAAKAQQATDDARVAS